MTWIWFILIGILAGAIAGRLVQGKGFGLFGNLLIGVVGAVFGAFLFDIAGLTATGTLGQLIVATVGAVVVLLIANMVKGK